MIHLIYLAAGNSKRFGEENKLLHIINGKAMFMHGFDILCEIHKTKNDINLIVVTQFDEITEYAKRCNVNCALNLKADEGISSSIKVGINSIDKVKNSDYYVFVLADQPFLTKETVLKLMSKADGNILTACVMAKGLNGSPTMFSAKLRHELLNLSGDVGGKFIMQKYKPLKVEIFDKCELLDIDEKSAN